MEAAIILEPAIRIINRLQRERIIERYAIGGAFGVVFYSEPILTYDLDVRILLRHGLWEKWEIFVAEIPGS